MYHSNVATEAATFATTTPFAIGGGGVLHLNVETLGARAIFVEMLDAAMSLPLPGQSAADCGPVAGNFLRPAVDWRLNLPQAGRPGAADEDEDEELTAAAVVPKEVAPKFVFRGEVDLYSYWFEYFEDR